MRTVVRGKNLKFSDSFGIGINVEGGIAAVIHIVSAIEFPVVVLRASPFMLKATLP